MKNRALLVVAVAMVALVLGCAASPPQVHDFNPVATIDGDFDAVWSAIVEYFAITNLPIQTIEKDSGLIVTSWMDASQPIGNAENKTFCDCGKASFMSTVLYTRGQFSVFVKTNPSGGTDLRVTCNYQQPRETMDVVMDANCVSTGYLEGQLHDYARAKVEGAHPPTVPIFKPGHSGK